MSEPVTIYARVGRVRENMKNQGFNDCRYIKIIYVHCGEEMSVRDPGSYKHYWASRFFFRSKGAGFLLIFNKKNNRAKWMQDTSPQNTLLLPPNARRSSDGKYNCCYLQERQFILKITT